MLFMTTNFTPDSTIPINSRARYLILLSQSDYESIDKQVLNDYLAPLFPLTRPSNDKKIERPLNKKPAPTTPTKSTSGVPKHIAEQFEMFSKLSAVLAANKNLTPPSSGTPQSNAPKRTGIILGTPKQIPT